MEVWHEHTTQISGINSKPSFYCLGDRLDQYGTLPDFVVLFIAEQAVSFEEARREFEEYAKEAGEKMRLNVIVKTECVAYYESIR